MTRRSPLPFDRLLEPLRLEGLLLAVSGDVQTPVTQLALDSRKVEPGACFFALTGEQTDGHRFIDDALQSGAATVICERPPAEEPPGLRALAHVTDARAALAEAAAVFFERPSQALRLVGITGTNGKTTTSYLLHHALNALGAKAGLIGTIEARIGEQVITATHTTPDTVTLHAMLAEMVEAGCSACAMEVSSHALHQERVRAQRFAVAVFTNLTHDHLDYHGSAEAYRDTKARLFQELDAKATAVVNRDDPAWIFMVKEAPARVVTYGMGPGGQHEPTGSDIPVEADVAFTIEENAISGLRLRIDGTERRFRMAGAFNAYNIAAAYATLRSLGHGTDEVLDALAEAPPVPGRLETIRPEGDVPGPIVVVDYAHTPDALENVLQTVGEMVPQGGALSVVFGCGGERDRAKRPLMGRAAERLADRVVLTSDNPRTEDPAAILRDIVVGMRTEPAAIELDRAAAIRQAIDGAGERDVIVVAGKGHEPYQIIGRTSRPFDDREEVRNALRDRSSRPS